MNNDLFNIKRIEVDLEKSFEQRLNQIKIPEEQEKDIITRSTIKMALDTILDKFMPVIGVI